VRGLAVIATADHAASWARLHEGHRRGVPLREPLPRYTAANRCRVLQTDSQNDDLGRVAASATIFERSRRALDLG
ncbi:MAG TPA: hypothetical protein VGS17_08250, partial [Candidatus Limnocylindria bacterium]|nr:hypothetical protein [Candidatus Limnocylindria bacterium]